MLQYQRPGTSPECDRMHRSELGTNPGPNDGSGDSVSLHDRKLRTRIRFPENHDGWR
jgi:hypothetical protein